MHIIPDIRKIINTIQGSTVDGIVKLDKASLKNDLNEQIINALSNKILLQEIRQILADSGSRECRLLVKQLQKLVNHVEMIHLHKYFKCVNYLLYYPQQDKKL